MKRNIFRLSIMILCAAVGWSLGYLRLPMVESNSGFWVGFWTCLAILILIFLMRLIWNQNQFLMNWMWKNKANNDPKLVPRTYLLMWTFVSTVLILAFVVAGLMINRQSAFLKTSDEVQNKRILELTEMTESIRKGNPVVLMSHVLNQVEADLKSNSVKGLSDATIARVAALSYSLKPYRKFEDGNLSKLELSPERGQLLLSLILMDIDTTSFIKIKKSASFTKSDLSEAELSNANLSGINLSEADLSHANLNGAILKNANLRSANFSGANLMKVELSGSDMRRANLSWAQLDNSTLMKVNFTAANLEGGKFRNVKMQESTFQWAKLVGAMFNEANLTSCDMARSDLKRANLTNANLTNARIDMATINESNFTNATMNHVQIQNGWMAELPKWQVTGTEEIMKKYYVLTDSSWGTQGNRYYLELKSN